MNTQYIPLTKEQIARAQHSDLIAFLRSRGENIHPSGTRWIWSRHDSVRIQGYMWYQNSTQKSGAAVAFVEYFYGVSFPEAVLMLLKLQVGTYTPANLPKQSRNTKFVLPARNADMRRAYSYLTVTRGLASDIVADFMESGSIYEDERHNVVFVGFDQQGKPRSAHKRGTYTLGEKKYRGDVKNSEKRFGFASRGKSDTLFIFEAAIDLLSFITLHHDTPWHLDSYVSLSGLSEEALKQTLNDAPYIKCLHFCLDNDMSAVNSQGNPENHGQISANFFAEKYRSIGYKTDVVTPTKKDWNEVLTGNR
ncbi:MAG: DUF3991 and TOPRIM domain-containing protein [Oscillospiraceae bacterium]